MNTLMPNVSEHDYHNDKIDMETPTLSASCAKDIIAKSPLHAWTFHPRLGGGERESTDATDRGSIVHALLLGQGRDIVSVEANDWRTNAAKDARAAAQDAGKIAMLAKSYKKISDATAIIRARIERTGIKLDGQSEVTGVWLSPEGVLCRCRFDHLPSVPTDIFDIKTCESAHPQAIQRAIENFGYDIQAEAYCEARATITPGLGPLRYRWIFAECEAPYAVTIVRYGGSMAELGRRRWTRAKARWKECLATNNWPAYVDGEIEAEATEWAIKRETELEYNANPGAEGVF